MCAANRQGRGMKRRSHPYLRFRTRMAHHALLQFAASVQSSLEIIALAFAPMLLGLCACIALPGLYAATLPWPQMLALLAAQIALAAAPAILLRKRLHPADVLAWSYPLPLPPALRWQADAAVAGMLMLPLAGMYAISSAIWLYQWPDWLRPVATLALTLTALSLLLAWLLATLVLARRARLPAARAPRRQVASATSYVPQALRPRAFHLWRQLFWLPFWRAENPVGIQQTVLLIGALASVAVWLWHPPLAALWGASASTLLVLLTDRGDKAVREQSALLAPVLADWPIDSARVFLHAAVFSLLPGACVMLLFAALAYAAPAGALSLTTAKVWLGGAAVVQSAIVAMRGISARARVGLVFGAVLVLTAIGSELWK